MADLLNDDPHLWLEDVDGDAALDWVRARNKECETALCVGDFDTRRARLLEVFDCDERIPLAALRGGYLYNFWRDAHHPRGLWRRTTMASYRSNSTDWEILLDLDALASVEGENWVYAGAESLPPDHRRALLSLSRGGADAKVVREFDLEQRRFVDDGFIVPEAKTRVAWRDIDHLFIGTDTGPGSLTDSGYPRRVRLWKRGTPLQSAPIVFEGEQADVSVYGARQHTPGYERDLFVRGSSFHTAEYWMYRGDVLTRVPVPAMVDIYPFKDWLLVQLREDWVVGEHTFVSGSLIVGPLEQAVSGDAAWTVLFEPTADRCLIDCTLTLGHVVLTVLDRVQTRLEAHEPAQGGWQRVPVHTGAGNNESLEVRALDRESSDGVWVRRTGYLTPSTLSLADSVSAPAVTVKALPAMFEHAGLEVAQHWVSSDDGTRVCYFQVGPGGTCGPTLLFGYGGFQVSMLPEYRSSMGAGWLERGRTLVIANIRGGGEFGPAWHQAALREKRHKAYEDFAAVARDLVRRGVTTRGQLAAMGGSNGGLLMGNMYTTYADLFGAIVCAVPLLDMRRYHKLLAGASWVAEYGDPDDPDDWAFMRQYSAYHNLGGDGGKPPLLLTTSTRDDRVHPGHARKFAAALRDLGRDVLYHENIEGGHGGAANNAQMAFNSALIYSFLDQTLG